MNAPPPPGLPPYLTPRRRECCDAPVPNHYLTCEDIPVPDLSRPGCPCGYPAGSLGCQLGHTASEAA